MTLSKEIKSFIALSETRPLKIALKVAIEKQWSDVTIAMEAELANRAAWEKEVYEVL